MFQCQALEPEDSDDDEDNEEKPKAGVSLRDLVGNIGWYNLWIILLIIAKNQEKKEDKKIALNKKDLKKKELEELEKVLAELGCNIIFIWSFL